MRIADCGFGNVDVRLKIEDGSSSRSKRILRVANPQPAIRNPTSEGSMLRVALTGGIATGKTYVLDRLQRLGVPVIDADRLARRALDPGTTGAKAVIDRFGPSILDADGAIDRQKLATLVFDDSDARRSLESIVHPEVYRAIETWWEERAAEGVHAFGVADVPLLYETGRASAFDRVIATVCDRDRQIARVKSRDGLSDAAARKRLAAQMPADEKAQRADFVVHTDGAAEETDRQIDEVIRALREAVR